MIPITDKQVKCITEFGNTVFSSKFIRRFGLRNTIKELKDRFNLEVTIRRCSYVDGSHPFYVAEEKREE